MVSSVGSAGISKLWVTCTRDIFDSSNFDFYIGLLKEQGDLELITGLNV
ncbi:hypothetical protein H6G97_13180 [Nostoc flagelliforme FACHB-838]|uniref:Transposase n=1 Tax=Nostoc flagelliforme FACHB-838 TaxID=2692904 RepID=A0ABR8DNX5_9NOSO|nr:hypothetical protein [Nostoc flagelliforme FACHB-838]